MIRHLELFSPFPLDNFKVVPSIAQELFSAGAVVKTKTMVNVIHQRVPSFLSIPILSTVVPSILREPFSAGVVRTS